MYEWQKYVYVKISDRKYLHSKDAKAVKDEKVTKHVLQCTSHWSMLMFSCAYGSYLSCKISFRYWVRDIEKWLFILLKCNNVLRFTICA